MALTDPGAMPWLVHRLPVLKQASPLRVLPGLQRGVAFNFATVKGLYPEGGTTAVE
jgi:hypothetical protein